MERNPDAKLQNLDAMPGNPDVEDRRRRSESDRRSREMLGDGGDKVTNCRRNCDPAVIE